MMKVKRLRVHAPIPIEGMRKLETTFIPEQNQPRGIKEVHYDKGIFKLYFENMDEVICTGVQNAQYWSMEKETEWKDIAGLMPTQAKTEPKARHAKPKVQPFTQ